MTVLKQLSAALPIKRPHEFALLRRLFVEDGATEVAVENELLKLIDTVSRDTLHHACEHLNQEYDDKGQHERSVRLCSYDRDHQRLIRTDALNQLLRHAEQKAYLIDVLNYGLHRYKQTFGSADYGVPFIKHYEQYTMIDAALLSNYRKTLSSFRGSGLLKNGNDYFLFIDLHKEKDIKESINYQDRLISASLFQWESPNNKSQDTEQGQRLIHNKKYGVRLHLFLRKYKTIDSQSEPYIYIGTGDVVTARGNKPITMEIALHQEIPASLYREFTTKV